MRLALAALFALTAPAPPVSFTLDQVKSYPFPNQLTAAATGSRIAWAFNEQGLRNVWVAEGPAFAARRLTGYSADDGQEISSVSVSDDGRYVVYVRGGDHGGSDAAVPVNPLSSPTPPKTQVWAMPFAGGEPKLLGEGDDPVLSPQGDRVAFLKDRQIWLAPIDGSAEAKRAIAARGAGESPRWSPDGTRLAFVSNRDDHSWVGVFTSEAAPIVWLAPSTGRDSAPAWSPDGKRIAFVRRPGAGGAPEPLLTEAPRPWALWTADAATGEGRALWNPPTSPRGSFPDAHGGANLHWAAAGRIVFVAYLDGWPHLYSLPEAGGEPRLLTPGPFMVEHVRLSPDRRVLVFAANTGSDPDDVDRRHVVRVPVDRAEPRVLTPGTGLEWSPIPTGDGRQVAFIGATPQRPPLPSIVSSEGGEVRAVGADRMPADFPTAQLVAPRPVVFRAPDGLELHGQLFARSGSARRRPAVIYIHGGPPRQMLLGWHYSDYYSNAYALNQYLASRGFVVLSINYRLGIGYGYEFHHPTAGGPRGAAEYQDVKAAGEWLRSRPEVDPARIGLWGGSYGGYLTALGLARDSALFAAGVDVHGVHDWTRLGPPPASDRYEKPADLERAREVVWRSSPVADVGTWRSPVLLIHGDDDRNVRFFQTVDLVRRLAAAGVPYEELVIPDDTHHFMRHVNQLRVNRAAAEFLERTLLPQAKPSR